MFSFSVNGKTYKVKFGYGVLTQSDILTQVSSMGAINNPKDMIKMLPELILVGLQKSTRMNSDMKPKKKRKLHTIKCAIFWTTTKMNPQRKILIMDLLYLKKQIRSLKRTVFIRNGKSNGGEIGGRKETSEDSAGSQEEELTFPEVVYKKLLPLYLSIGVSEEKFMDSTPYDLEPYMEAYKLKQKMADSQAWQFNMYTMCAVQTAVANVLIGKKSKAEYLKEPFSQTAEKQKQEDEENLSETEKKRQRDRLLMTLQLMQANFELNHGNNDEGRQD